ncbi:MAG: hypothetical protein MUQ00_04010 [Candidatus Aminicenantes bacterium]|nr:hypothetical protein [Candidatus Aminicenantes bacterium]
MNANDVKSDALEQEDTEEGYRQANRLGKTHFKSHFSPAFSYDIRGVIVVKAASLTGFW